MRYTGSVVFAVTSGVIIVIYWAVETIIRLVVGG